MYGSPYDQTYLPSFDVAYTHIYPSCDSSSSYVCQSPSTSEILPSDLPDLYYEYGLATSPSVSSSEAICTPSLVSTLPWEQAATTTAQAALMLQPSMGDTDMQLQSKRGAFFDPQLCQFGQTTRYFMTQDDTEESRNPEPSSEENFITHSLIDISMGFISPAAVLEPITSMPSVSQIPLKLHQPRPSRKIPIVNLDRLACAFETPSPPEETPKLDNSLFRSTGPQQSPVAKHIQLNAKNVPICANQDTWSLSCMEPYTL